MKHVLYLTVLFLVACGQSKKESATVSGKGKELLLDYAKGFSVTYRDGAKWVEIKKPFQGAETSIKYLLVQKGQPVPAHDDDDVKVIPIPIEKMVCMSTTHIPLLDYLDESDKLVGFPTTNYISSKKTRKYVEAGKVADLGVDKEMNLEMLLALDAEVVMGYSINGNLGQFRQIEQVGIPVVLNAEFLETHPLGRAEWIKFMALFFNKEEKAEAEFEEIRKKYEDLKEKVSGIAERPTVMSGVVYGDTWFLPGGGNYAARLMQDAGCRYLWSENKATGFLELSFESVYEEAHAADYWIGTASYNSFTALQEADSRYADFEAFQKQNIYSYNARMGEKGGSEFLELGYLRPDLILADMVKITHPELLPEHELYFHMRLNE